MHERGGERIVSLAHVHCYLCVFFDFFCLCVCLLVLLCWNIFVILQMRLRVAVHYTHIHILDPLMQSGMCACVYYVVLCGYAASYNVTLIQYKLHRIRAHRRHNNPDRTHAHTRLHTRNRTRTPRDYLLPI